VRSYFHFSSSSDDWNDWASARIFEEALRIRTRTRTRTNTNPNGTEVNAAGRNVCACRSTMQTNRQISYFIFRISYLASDWYGTANRKQWQTCAVICPQAPCFSQFHQAQGGGLDPNKSIHSGVKFRHLVRVLQGPNKRGVCKPSLILSWIWDKKMLVRLVRSRYSLYKSKFV
jgi:hypothetical protein